jgi:hypothetical protein
LVATRVTRWVPGVVKYTEGLVSVEEPKVPKVHEKEEPPMGVVVLVKLTSRGAQPDMVLAVNPAVSALAD